jgi:hypothetical protein
MGIRRRTRGSFGSRKVGQATIVFIRVPIIVRNIIIRMWIWIWASIWIEFRAYVPFIAAAVKLPLTIGVAIPHRVHTSPKNSSANAKPINVLPLKDNRPMTTRGQVTFRFSFTILTSLGLSLVLPSNPSGIGLFSSRKKLLPGFASLLTTVTLRLRI